MTDAITGNTMIPSNPGIVAQQVEAGAQQVAPISSGAPPTVGEQSVPPAPPTEAYDFWSGVEQRIDPATQEVPPVAQPAPPEQVVAPPVQPPTAPAPVQAPPVQAPGITPEQQAAIVEAGAMEQGYQQPAVPAQAPVQAPAQDFAAFEAQTIEHLARTEYALPPDQANALVARPEEVYPQLAARLHVRLASQIGKAVQDFLPSVIDQVVTAKMEASRLEDNFFRSYPQLSDQRFRPVVAQSLRMARQASPNASREQVMNDGAALAAMKLRIQPAAVQQPVAAQPSQFNGQQQPVAPFQPAVGGMGGLPTPQVPDIQNEFEALAMDQNW